MTLIRRLNRIPENMLDEYSDAHSFDMLNLKKEQVDLESTICIESVEEKNNTNQINGKTLIEVKRFHLRIVIKHVDRVAIKIW